jgi:ABC-type transporter Mla subunit MlaD
MNGTIKFTDRYIQITPGHAGTDFVDDALVPAHQYTAPVEYDSVFNIFDPKTLGAMKSLLDNSGPFFSASAPSLHQAIAAAPPALTQVDAVFRDVDSEAHAFSALLNSGAAVTHAVAGANPNLQQLITGAANTFTAVASESRQLKTALSAAPAALTSAGTAARRFGTTIDLVEHMGERINPGINQLREIAAPLDATLHEVVNVEPPAVKALSAITTGGKPIQGLLTTARTSLMPQAKRIGTQLKSILQCVRPYTPDLSEFFLTWSSYLGTVGLDTPRTGFFQGLLSVLPISPESLDNTAQLAKGLPDYSKSLFPQVPGEGYNQPWFQPQCGLTAARTSVANDSENNTFDPLGEKSISYPSS